MKSPIEGQAQLSRKPDFAAESQAQKGLLKEQVEEILIEELAPLTKKIDDLTARVNSLSGKLIIDSSSESAVLVQD